MTMRYFSLCVMAAVLAGCQAADAVNPGAAATSESNSDVTTAAEETPSTTDEDAATTESDVVQVSGERIIPVPLEDLPQTEEEWKEKLTDEQFYVLRKHGTERAGSGEYADGATKVEGIFHCAGCGEPLFDAKTKFKSGTGWPSFYDVLGEVGEHVETRADRSLFVTRTEVHCKRCGGHLGHVFEDGPAPTGLRYCMNSVSLKLGPPAPEQEPDEK